MDKHCIGLVESAHTGSLSAGGEANGDWRETEGQKMCPVTPQAHAVMRATLCD